jgi:hypothetical protein
MRKFNLLLTLLLIYAAPAAFPARAQQAPAAAPPPPVVLELFSSQTCPFCPQADSLFARYAADPHYIALACHVDYDALNDPFARGICTQRQDSYVRELEAGVSYTPQLVVNGAREAVGYKAAEVGAAIEEAAAQEPVAPITFTPEPSADGYKVHWRGRVRPAPGARPPHIWLAMMLAPQKVPAEKAGASPVYANIVNRVQDLGTWPPTVPAQVLHAPLAPGETGFALLVQDEASGRIVAAGQLARKR